MLGFHSVAGASKNYLVIERQGTAASGASQGLPLPGLQLRPMGASYRHHVHGGFSVLTF